MEIKLRYNLDKRTWTGLKVYDRLLDYLHSRDVSTGATGTTAVAPKFSNTPILSQPRGGGGGQILPTIAEVTTKLSPNRISFNTNSNVTNFLLDLNNPPTFSKFLGL